MMYGIKTIISNKIQGMRDGVLAVDYSIYGNLPELISDTVWGFDNF